MKLRDCKWWPAIVWSVGSASSNQRVDAQEVSQYGILEACRLTELGVLIDVDYRGRTVVGRVAAGSFNSPGNLRSVCDFLEDYASSSIATVEDLDVEADQFD